MKKLFLAMSVIIGMMLISSCSGDSTAKLLNAIPAETDIVVVGNVKTIIESAGGSIAESQIKLPKIIADKLDANDTEAFDKFNEMLKNSGIDTDQAAMAVSYTGNHPIFVGMIADRSKFISFIEDNHFNKENEKDGVEYYSAITYESEYDPEYNDYSYVAVKNQYAYFIADVWAGSRFKPFEALEDIIEEAEKDPMSKTELAEYISKGNACGMSVRIPEELINDMAEAGNPIPFADLYKGYVCLYGSLNGDKGELNLKWFDEDGKPKNFKEFNQYMNTGARINNKALAYLDTNEQAVFAVAMEDVQWNKYLDMISKTPGFPAEAGIAMSVASAYLEKINGTLAIGIGINGGLQSLANITEGRNILAELPATFVIQTNEGKAEGIIKDVKGMLQSVGLPYTETAEGFTLEVAELGGAVYGEALDDMLIFSTTTISKDNANATVNTIDFDKYTVCGGIVLNRDNKLMQDLGIDYDIIATSVSDVDSAEGSMTLQIKGGENEGLIAKMLNIGFGIADRQQSIMQQWNGYTGNSFESPSFADDYDDVVVEEAVEVEI